jgi:hypothetical protein
MLKHNYLRKNIAHFLVECCELVIDNARNEQHKDHVCSNVHTVIMLKKLAPLGIELTTFALLSRRFNQMT